MTRTAWCDGVIAAAERTTRCALVQLIGREHLTTPEARLVRFDASPYGERRLLLTTSILPRPGFIRNIGGTTLAVALLSGSVTDDWHQHTLA